MTKNVLKILFLLVIASSVTPTYGQNIEIKNFENYINIAFTPKIYKVEIKNITNNNLPINITLSIPLKYKTLESYNVLLPNEAKNFVYEIIPDEQLSGQSYEGTLIIKAADEEIKKKLIISISKKIEQNSFEISKNYYEKDEKIIVEFDIKNKNLKDILVKVEETKIPNGWKFIAKQTRIIALGKDKINLEIIPNSDYKGEVEIKLNVDGLIVKENINIDHKQNIPIISGLLGFASAESIRLGILTINIILIIAIFLLFLALFSRIINRTRFKEETKPQKIRPVWVEPKRDKLEYLKEKIIERDSL